MRDDLQTAGEPEKVALVTCEKRVASTGAKASHTTTHLPRELQPFQEIDVYYMTYL